MPTATIATIVQNFLQFDTDMIPLRSAQLLAPRFLLLNVFAPEVLNIDLVLAGVFVSVGIRHQTRLPLNRPSLRVHLGIIDGHLNLQVAEIGPAKTFDHMESVRCRLACLIEPCLPVKASSIDNKRVAV